MHGIFSTSFFKQWSPASLGSAVFGSYDPGDVSTMSLVATLPCRALSAQDLTQSNPALAPTMSTTASSPVLSFASADFLQASVSRDWSFLHNGTGCTYLGFVKPTNNGSSGVVFDTGPWNVGDRGLGIWYDGTNQYFTVFMSNGTALIISTNTGAGSYPRNVGHVLCFQYDETQSPKYALYIDNSTTPVLSGSPTGAPSTGDPVGPLFIGVHTAGHGTNFTGLMGIQCFITRSITASERKAAMTALRAKYGL